MQRTVISPADLSGQPLNDLKDWLGISRPNEDNLLKSLLEASLALCEAFTGQAPMTQVIEEVVATSGGLIVTRVRPVQGLVSAESIDDDGNRIPIASENFEFSVNAEGEGCFRFRGPNAAPRVVLTLQVGIAADWDTLPRPLKQGMIRLAAYNYRDREGGRGPNPPASVAALWRPWRVLRFA